MNRLRVAAVGACYFSQFHLRAWRAIPEVELLAWCDRDPAKAHAYSNPLEMLEREKPDLLDIVTPPDSHLELVAAAARRGVPVICQKPLSGASRSDEALPGAGKQVRKEQR